MGFMSEFDIPSKVVTFKSVNNQAGLLFKSYKARHTTTYGPHDK